MSSVYGHEFVYTGLYDDEWHVIECHDSSGKHGVA